MIWMLLVLVYGLLKGVREILKKKALTRNSVMEVLFLYTLISFGIVMVTELGNRVFYGTGSELFGLTGKELLLILLKSFVIFIAWMCSFYTIKKLPISLYGVLDLARVLFATLLGLLVLHESVTVTKTVGLIFVGVGLLFLKGDKKPVPAETGGKRKKEGEAGEENPAWKTEEKNPVESREALQPEMQKPDETKGAFRPELENPVEAKEAFQPELKKPCGTEETWHREIKNPAAKPRRTAALTAYPVLVLLAMVSCLLNAVSGTMDKILMRSLSSGQLQFWYMLFLVLMYFLYICISRTKMNWRSCFTNHWVWILSIAFVIADRCLFIANSYEESQVTIMTLIKQSGCIVTILGGKFVFGEKNIGYRLMCAVVVIAGIVIAVM